MALRRARFALRYRFGRPRWDTGITPPELVEVVEGPATLPPGRALDLGCGTGTNAVYLAVHGWEATGVDFIATAVARARRRARGMTGAPRFVTGDVTRLGELGITGRFDLVVDIGCFHGIPAGRRPAYVDGVARVTSPGATLLMFAFGAGGGGRGPAFTGATEAEITARLGGSFEIVEVRRGEEDHPGERRLPAWYRLLRR